MCGVSGGQVWVRVHACVRVCVYIIYKSDAKGATESAGATGFDGCSLGHQ